MDKPKIINNQKEYNKFTNKVFGNSDECNMKDVRNINFDKYFLFGLHIASGVCENGDSPKNPFKSSIDIDEKNKQINYKLIINKNKKGNACSGIFLRDTLWSLIPKQYSDYEVKYNAEIINDEFDSGILLEEKNTSTKR